MTDSSIKRLAIILAIQAKIEGMKACNKNAELSSRRHLPYDGSHFYSLSQKLLEVSKKPDEEL